MTRTSLIAGNSLKQIGYNVASNCERECLKTICIETISSRDANNGIGFNGQPVMAYTQASGNKKHPFMGGDMVYSSTKVLAV